MMPDFFEKDFSVATATGFIRVWDGTYVMLRYVEEHLEQLGINSGANCIELGSGTGLLGIALASMGGNVLLSDVKSSIDRITSYNILANSTELRGPDSSSFFVKGIASHAIGSGAAASLPIDWNKPTLDSRVAESLSKCDWIFACDCIWHPEFASACSEMCARLLRGCRQGTRVLLSYPHRGSDPKCTRPRDIENFFQMNGMRLKWIFTQPANSKNIESFEISLLEASLEK